MDWSFRKKIFVCLTFLTVSLYPYKHRLKGCDKEITHITDFSRDGRRNGSRVDYHLEMYLYPRLLANQRDISVEK